MFVFSSRNNVDDVAVLRKELHNVQTLMMSDINEMKTDTKLEEMRQENEALKSELSKISLKHVADSSTHNLELKYAQEEKNRLQAEHEKLNSRIEELSSHLESAEETVISARRKTDEVYNIIIIRYMFLFIVIY